MAQSDAAALSIDALPTGLDDVDADIVRLAQRLVRIPSRAGIDDVEPVLTCVADWLDERGLPARRLYGRDGRGGLVGVFSSFSGDAGGPHLCLNACADTAPFGDDTRWSMPPTSGSVADGWLFGRGAADSKIAVALFLHLFATATRQSRTIAGKLSVLIDGDEHSGAFGGIVGFVDAATPIDGVIIGYPGHDRICTGARGFLRADLLFRGSSGHSGASEACGDNAIVKAARFVAWTASAAHLLERDETFGLPPKITVTGISGGESHSIVPDRCRVGVDVRLTPRFDSAWAEALLVGGISACELRPDVDVSFAVTSTWPAYRLAENEPLLHAIVAAFKDETGRTPDRRVVGPSNIGNYLSVLGIPALCGFGVRYRGLHDVDEAIEMASLPIVRRIYARTIERFFAGGRR